MDMFSQVVAWHAQSLVCCTEILELLQKERAALIELDRAKISEILLLKDDAVRRLQKIRERIFLSIESHWRVTDREQFEAALAPEQRQQWAKAREEWHEKWALVVALVHQNQTFLRMSVKNLSRLADHMKQLLGESQTYSSRGDRMDSSGAGKILEARY